MDPASHAEGRLSAVPLLNAVFCAECETITDSPHDACTICGSHSLTNLFRMVGGTLRSQKAQSAGDRAKTAKYNLELTVKMNKIPAAQLNHVIEFVSQLAEVGGEVEAIHINVEPVADTQGVLRVA